MASEPRLSTRRSTYRPRAAPRDRRGELTTRFELDVEDRRSIEAHSDAIVPKRSLDFSVVLNEFRREELQARCAALGLDGGGREKVKLVERIMALASRSSVPDVADDERYPTREAAIASIGEYIEDFYNLVRRHSYRDYLSPIDFELKKHIEEEAA